MILARTERFKREFTRLPASFKNRAEKQLALLLHNPAHPSLRVEKMRGYPDIWEGRIAEGYRFTFQITGTALYLYSVAMKKRILVVGYPATSDVTDRCGLGPVRPGDSTGRHVRLSARARTVAWAV